MHPLRWLTLMGFVAGALMPCLASAQFGQRVPHIGYVYPAGAQRGATVEIEIGGQYLDGAKQVIVSGQGVRAEITRHKKPLTVQQVNRLREKLEEARKKLRPAARGNVFFPRPGNLAQFRKMALEAGVTEEELDALAEFRKQRTDPKAQPNPQIEERVMMSITVDPKAEVGQREIRLVAANGLSNPLYFHVGDFAEHREAEPNGNTPDRVSDVTMPFVVNGQILPGDVDRYSFDATKGDRLVVAASARKLIPYLADAVPGWFQATLSLQDSAGKEIAFADDFRFHPDPVFYFEIPEDGTYTLEIKDALYRGRADFVYRITVGEIPFVTSIFPLGGPCDGQTDLELLGWNLTRHSMTMDASGREPGVHSLATLGDERLVHHVLFATESLSETAEQEPNNDREKALRVYPPLIVNGRIDEPGDWDAYAFHCRAGGQIVAEVKARRLNSPLDSVLRLVTAEGRELAVNDDHEDKSAGLTTHHADSRLSVTIPDDGLYYLHLGDTQGKGGPDFAYRLHINAQRPDFELRVVPSSINARAGTTVPLTVHALRKDGFTGDIQLALADPPEGFRLSGGWVPEGHDRVRLTLTVPPGSTEKPISLRLEGWAKIDGRIVRRTAVPADDLMQAFIYRHLVPAEKWLVAVTGNARFRGLPPRGNSRFAGARRMGGRFGDPYPLRRQSDKPIEVAPGESARVPLPIPARLIPDGIALELSDAPEGISIEMVSSGLDGKALLVKADAEKARVGVKGNLIVNAFVERSFKRPDGSQSPARKLPLGTLPAIPFQIVAEK
jgi:hypothetical protein